MICALRILPSVLAVLVPSSLSSVPASVKLLSDPTAYAGYQGQSEQVIAKAGEPMPEFDIGYTYVASFATGAIDSGTFSVTSVTFQKYSFPALDCRNYPFAYAFSSIMQSTYLYLYESAYCFDSSSGTFNKFNYSAESANYTYGILTHDYTLVSNASGPYVIKFSDSASWFSNVSKVLYPQFQSQAAISTAMWDEGYSEGYERGYTSGSANGYIEGLNDADAPTGLIGSLFSAVVSVPLNVLNGLTPLAIWNVPIISIIMSFLFLGVVFWLIRKFI